MVVRLPHVWWNVGMQLLNNYTQISLFVSLTTFLGHTVVSDGLCFAHDVFSFATKFSSSLGDRRETLPHDRKLAEFNNAKSKNSGRGHTEKLGQNHAEAIYLRTRRIAYFSSVTQYKAVAMKPNVTRHDSILFLYFCILCRDWSNFTTCLSTSGATFDDMYQYLSSFWFNYIYYNGSVGSYKFFCSQIERE